MKNPHANPHKIPHDFETNDFITIKTALEEFPVSKSTIYHLIYGGTLPYYKPMPRRILINRREVVKWIVASRRAGLLDSIPDEAHAEEAGAPA